MQISGIKHLYCSTVLSIIVFSVFTNETLNSFNNSSPLLPHSATVSMNLHTLGTLYKSNCAIFCPFVTGSFHTPCCQGSSMLLHVLEFHSFLMLSNILLHVVFFFFSSCLRVHLLTNMWVVSTSSPLSIMMLWTLVSKYLFESLFSIILSILLFYAEFLLIYSLLLYGKNTLWCSKQPRSDTKHLI